MISLPIFFFTAFYSYLQVLIPYPYLSYTSGMALVGLFYLTTYRRLTVADTVTQKKTA